MSAPRVDSLFQAKRNRQTMGIFSIAFLCFLKPLWCCFYCDVCLVILKFNLTRNASFLLYFLQLLAIIINLAFVHHLLITEMPCSVHTIPNVDKFSSSLVSFQLKSMNVIIRAKWFIHCLRNKEESYCPGSGINASISGKNMYRMDVLLMVLI